LQNFALTSRNYLIDEEMASFFRGLKSKHGLNLNAFNEIELISSIRDTFNRKEMMLQWITCSLYLIVCWS